MKQHAIPLVLALFASSCSYVLTDKSPETGVSRSSCTTSLAPPIADTTGAVLAWAFVALAAGAMIYATATYEPPNNGSEGDSRSYTPVMIVGTATVVLGSAVGVPYTLAARTGFKRVEQCRRNSSPRR